MEKAPDSSFYFRSFSLIMFQYYLRRQNFVVEVRKIMFSAFQYDVYV